MQRMQRQMFFLRMQGRLLSIQDFILLNLLNLLNFLNYLVSESIESTFASNVLRSFRV